MVMPLYSDTWIICDGVPPLPAVPLIVFAPEAHPMIQ